MSSTLLVVDDDQNVCDTLVACLEAELYRVLRALDGRQALDLLRGRTVDLVLTDLLLAHGISGETVAETAALAGTAVITMSGAIASDRQGRDLSGRHLQKPIRRAILLDAVAQALAAPRQPRRTI